jgi:hypothetical protein
MQNTVLRTSDTEELIEILALLETIAAESKHISNVHVETAQNPLLSASVTPQHSYTLDQLRAAVKLPSVKSKFCVPPTPRDIIA